MHSTNHFEGKKEDDTNDNNTKQQTNDDNGDDDDREKKSLNRKRKQRMKKKTQRKKALEASMWSVWNDSINKVAVFEFTLSLSLSISSVWNEFRQFPRMAPSWLFIAIHSIFFNVSFMCCLWSIWN